MISVILYGRNDSYGYNLHKRAAISINCIAEVLTSSEDEIIFVDCNTPDDMPTFPEAISDTLTSQAKRLLRILRLRPSLYEKYKKGSPLKVLEPLSRNIAIRRSNPSNRWILSTNTDMVFVPRDPEKSLSDIVADLADGFYELPRFEVPEGIWESLNRTEPETIINTFRRLGKRFHLNEVIIARPIIRFDGPGDFQLMLREQIFSIDGFDEDMILGWHVDSNLCKRLYLLNSETKSLLNHVFAYHCDHTKQSTFLHSTKRTENSAKRFFDNVFSPFLPHQRETWGISNEEIEEIRLTDEYCGRLSTALENLLPGQTDDTTEDFFIPESYNHGEIYDTHKVIPHIADHLSSIPSSANIGYFGGNKELLHFLNKLLTNFNHKGDVLIDNELIVDAIQDKEQCLSGLGRPVEREDIIEKSDIFIFDTGMMHFPAFVDSKGISFVKPSKKADTYREKLKAFFLQTVKNEKARLRLGNYLPRKFLLISSQHTCFEQVTTKFIGITLTPYSTHVRHGYLMDSEKPDLFLPSLPLTIDTAWKEVINFVKIHIAEDEKLLGSREFGMCFPGKTYPYSKFIPEDIDINWVIIQKSMIGEVDDSFLERTVKMMKPVFVNEAFVIFTTNSYLHEINHDSPFYKDFLEKCIFWKIRENLSQS